MLTYDKDRGVYRIDLEGGLFGTDETWATGHTFGDAVESSSADATSTPSNGASTPARSMSVTSAGSGPVRGTWRRSI